MLMHAQPCGDRTHLRSGEFPSDYYYIDPWTLIDTCEYPVFSPTLSGLRTQCSVDEWRSRLAQGVNATLGCVKDQVAFNSSLESNSLSLVGGSTASDRLFGTTMANYIGNGTQWHSYWNLLTVIGYLGLYYGTGILWYSSSPEADYWNEMARTTLWTKGGKGYS